MSNPENALPYFQFGKNNNNLALAVPIQKRNENGANFQAMIGKSKERGLTSNFSSQLDSIDMHLSNDQGTRENLNSI